MFERYVKWEDKWWYVLIPADEWTELAVHADGDCVLMWDLEDTHIAPVAECEPLPFWERLLSAIGYRLRITWQRPYSRTIGDYELVFCRGRFSRSLSWGGFHRRFEKEHPGSIF